MSNNNFINPLDVQLQTEEEDICAICQENLSTSQTYKLPECHHNFHTHCIVTWFRMRPPSDDTLSSYLAQGGSCPCCGNRGINNNTSTSRSRYRFGNYLGSYGKERLRYMRNYSKKPEAPKKLISLFKRYDEAKKNLALAREKKANFIKTLKTGLVNFHEMDKKRREATTWVWMAQRKINVLELEIVGFPVIPIIIPTPIDIN